MRRPVGRKPGPTTVDLKGRSASWRGLSELSTTEAKNLLRGVVLFRNKSRSAIVATNRVRTKLPFSDLIKATELLFREDGLLTTRHKPTDYRSIQQIHNLAYTTSEREVAFICGHINSQKKQCLKTIMSMRAIGDLLGLEPLQQLQALVEFWQTWGMSDYLNRKIVFYMDQAEVDKAVVAKYRDFTKSLNLETAPEPYFSTMELLSDRYPYFESIKVLADILNKYKTNDFRQHNALNSALPVPLFYEDVGAFLRKAFSMSVPDELRTLKVVIALKDQWPTLVSQISKALDPEIMTALGTLERELAHLLFEPTGF